MKEMKEVLEKVYNVPSLRKSVVPLFIGDPGLGKSHIIHSFAESKNTKEKKVKVVELITSQMNPFEVSGIGMK